MSFASRAKSILEIGSTLLVTVAAGALLWTLYYRPPAATRGPAAGPQVETVTGLRIDGAKATKRIGKGSVVLVEFTDFQCPFCGRHARDTYPSLRRDFIEQDKLTYVSFAFPLERIHAQARQASEAAECAARQGRYWEMHDRLFSDQATLKEPDVFVRSAVAIGLDKERFVRCLAHEAAKAVGADIAEGERLKVSSTPTFFLGRIRPDGAIDLEKRITGAAPLAAFADAIVEATKKS